MTQYQSSNYYRGMDSQQRKYKLSSSRQKHSKQYNLSQQHYQYQQSIQDLKSQNLKLKKSLKQSNAKRTSLVKQCSQYQKHIQQLQKQIQHLKRKVSQEKIDKEGDRYRVQQLKFLNKQLSGQINQLRQQNDSLMDKVRYCSQVVQKKYEDLQQKMHKRIQQSIKRVKKSIHYLETLSIKDIQKTKEILIQNLKKANQILKGKYSQNTSAQHQIQQLMNPLKTIQDQLSIKNKELNLIKNQNLKLIQQVKKHKRIQNQLLPQYKLSIEGLKKNLAQVRSQLSQNQIEKTNIKKKYEEKIKIIEQQHNQLLIEYRKNKLEKKIFQNKLEELEQEKEQEKQRLVGENQMLKKLYDNRRKINTSNFNQYDTNKSDNEAFQNDYRQNERQQRGSLKNFRRNNKKRQQLNNHNRSLSQDENNIEGYNSSDYYGRIHETKPTKNTYGDQTTKQKKFFKKNRSYKQLKDFKTNQHEGQIISYQNSRVNPQYNRKVPAFERGASRQRQYKEYNRNKVKATYAQKINLGNKSDEEQVYDVQPNQRQRQNQQEYEYDDYRNGKYNQQEDSQYRPEDSSIMSQQSLKNQICKIDQQIMEIQKNLTKQLEAYK